MPSAGLDVRTALEAKLMMRPPPALIMCGSRNFAQRNEPLRLDSMTMSQSATDSSWVTRPSGSLSDALIVFLVAAAVMFLAFVLVVVGHGRASGGSDRDDVD